MDVITRFLADVPFSADSLFDLVFHAPFFPFFYALHCARVCAQIRRATPVHGLQWWRSFALGFCLVYGPRIFLGWVINRRPATSFVEAAAVYAGAWALFNITPFDLVARFFNRFVPKFLLAVFSEFGAGQLIVHDLWNATHAYQDRALTALTAYACAMALAPVIDVIDNAIFTNKRKWPQATVEYWKRTVAAAGIVILLCTPNALTNYALFSMYSAVPVTASIVGLLKIADFIIFDDDNEIVDFVFPEEVCELLFSFHPNC